jgi:single-strand DNA-binding protein
MSINKVILVGNLGKDPEIRYINENVPVANFTIATTERFKDKSGQMQDATEWHNIVAWRGLAEVAEKFLRKGKQVYVEGKIRSRSYDDKDGNKRYITEIVADVIQMLGARESDSDSHRGTTTSDTRPTYPQNTGNVQVDDDDLPF